uniref:SWIM-type domain-containing protein n=1 Tax=Arundo donax TaxID=35708 RepID=A0A0A9GRG2_ARUDO
MDSGASNTDLSSTGNKSETSFKISLRIPGYTAYLDDGSTNNLEASNHVLEVTIGGYSMCKLLTDVASKTKWGTCQEPTFWYWDIEKRGLQCVITDDDLNSVFQKFGRMKLVTFVVEFPIKPTYKSSMTMEQKMEKLPVRRNPNVAPKPINSEDNESEEDEENVDPAWMDDEDIFMDDHEVFVSLGLRAEDEAARINLEKDGAGLIDDNAQIPVDDYAENEPLFAIDKENPKIKKGETFPTMEDFRMALRQYAILNEFEVHKVKTDIKRYRAECKANGCPWRIVANRLVGQPTIEITMIPNEHECMGSGKLESKMASQKWVAERVLAWLKKKSALGVADLQDKLLEKYGVEVGYGTVWAGRQRAMDIIYGAWEDSFATLFNFRAELLQRSPGTIFEIATKKNEDDVIFDKLFVAMKPCIDGFQQGCRPYLGIDSTALNGKYKGHLASATALDGNNWMYHVAWAIFESESTENWTWFMRQLEKAIGHPPSLVISTDACKGLDAAVKEVFPGIEHRECMRYLWANFKKKYRGEVYDKNMWPAARAYKSDKFNFHFNQVVAASPDIIDYMNAHHNHLWSRSMFSNDIKCDYLNNNLAESFNNWIKKIKDLPLVKLIDRLRQMTMDLWDKRRRIGSKLSGVILPTIIKQLKAKTRGLRQMKVSKGVHTTEVFGFHYDMTPWRHVVELSSHTCSCGEWQMTGKPCPHALAFIQMLTWLLMSINTTPWRGSRLPTVAPFHP